MFDQREYLLHAWQPVLPFTGQAQPTGLALEQGITQMLLEGRDLSADGALGDMQLLPGTGEIAVLGGDQKCMQGG
ncbi:hypothetical protein D3C85_1877410 [compost metagenome]